MYFFDSYAIIESTKGNSNYIKYLSENVTLTIFNLVEVYYYYLNNSEEEADKFYARFRDVVVEVDDIVLKEAMKFRKQHKKKKLSYADCIGYVYALKNNLIFLTGDKEFEGMKNVEFVK